jgi:exportin-1
VLRQVVKHEWPHRWPSFISDLTGAAKISEVMCENCMHILKLLSEEVFDFSRGEMTQAKTRDLKSSLNNEFGLINELGEYVLTHSQKPLLISTTLTTLHAYLSWVPLGYIFESTLVETLLKLFPTLEFRNVALQCLAEIGALNVGAVYDQHFTHMYTVFITSLQVVLPRVGTNIPEAYANGSGDDQAFFQNLALFLTGFFKTHIGLLESTPDHQGALLIGLEYLLGISYVEDTEVFKVCLDYWNHLVCDLFQSECSLDQPPPTFGFQHLGATMPSSGRKQLYAMPMSRLRLLMISRMAKPEEVIVVEDENGNAVREVLKGMRPYHPIERIGFGTWGRAENGPWPRGRRPHFQVQWGASILSGGSLLMRQWGTTPCRLGRSGAVQADARDAGVPLALGPRGHAEPDAGEAGAAAVRQGV